MGAAPQAKLATVKMATQTIRKRLRPKLEREPVGGGEDDGVGDEVGGENPGGFVVGGGEGAGDVGEGDGGDGGVEDLHEGGEHDGGGDPPGIHAMGELIGGIGCGLGGGVGCRGCGGSGHARRISTLWQEVVGAACGS